jgi:AraC-like DNA-binding protein
LNLTLRGGRHVSQRGREVTLHAGQAVLASIDAAVTTMKASHFLSFRLRRAELGPRTADLNGCLLRPIPSNFALQLLPAYVGALEEAAAGTAEMRETVVAHVYDLVALALGADRDAAEVAAGRGVRAARLYAIKDDIVANLGDATLSTAAVAARQGISPRYVAMLFDGTGTSFSSFVLAQRLARAWRMLAGPRHAEQTISAIAYACGFGDLSYFNRAFAVPSAPRLPTFAQREATATAPRSKFAPRLANHPARCDYCMFPNGTSGKAVKRQAWLARANRWLA